MSTTFTNTLCLYFLHSRTDSLQACIASFGCFVLSPELLPTEAQPYLVFCPLSEGRLDFKKIKQGAEKFVLEAVSNKSERYGYR
jgi:hypothetical protein